MKIGMNLMLWTDTPSREHFDIVRKIKDWGFDGIEFPLDDMSDEDVHAYAELLRELNMGASGIIAMPSHIANPISDNATLRDNAVEYMKRNIEKAKILGVDVVAGPLYEGLGELTGSGPSAKEIEHCVETYNRIVPFAKEMNIVLAGEAINRFETHFVNTIDQAMNIVDLINSDYFGIHADTCHGNIEELDMAASIRKAGKRIKHIHLSENTRGIPGTGCAIRPDIFKAIKDIGYDNWLTIEAFDTSVPALASRLHIWRDMSENKEDIPREGIKFIKDSLNKYVL